MPKSDAAFREQIAHRVREARHAMGMSQEQLAAAADLSAPSVSRIETGTLAPGLAVAASLASALHLSLDELVGMEMDVSLESRPGLSHIERQWLGFLRTLDEAAAENLLAAVLAVRDSQKSS